MNFLELFYYVMLVVWSIFGLIALHRLYRMSKLYIRTGDIGSDNDTIIYNLDSDIDYKEAIHNFFNATNPFTILMDCFALSIVSLVFMVFCMMPYLALALFVIATFMFLLRKARQRFVKKQEFVEKLKGND